MKESQPITQRVQEITSSELEIRQTELSMRILMICLIPSRPYVIDAMLRLRHHSVEYKTIKRYLENLLKQKLITIVKDDETGRDLQQDTSYLDDIRQGKLVRIGTRDITLKDKTLHLLIGKRRRHVNPLFATTKEGQVAIRAYAAFLGVLKGKPFKY